MNVTVFYFVFAGIVLLRLIELLRAHSNEKWMRERGAREFGRGHYPFIVLLHICFFASLLLETGIKGYPLITGWQLAVAVLLLVQMLRYWVIFSLGRYWNTRILVIPGSARIRKGPYKHFRHPNYVIVVLELLLIPLIFKAWLTLVWVNIANSVVLYFRIKQEERALALLE